MNKRALMLTAAATALLSGHAYGASPCDATSTTGNCNISTAFTSPLYTGPAPASGVTSPAANLGNITIATNGSLTIGTTPPTGPAVTINSGTSAPTLVNNTTTISYQGISYATGVLLEEASVATSTTTSGAAENWVGEYYSASGTLDLLGAGTNKTGILIAGGAYPGAGLSDASTANYANQGLGVFTGATDLIPSFSTGQVAIGIAAGSTVEVQGTSSFGISLIGPTYSAATASSPVIPTGGASLLGDIDVGGSLLLEPTTVGSTTASDNVAINIAGWEQSASQPYNPAFNTTSLTNPTMQPYAMVGNLNILSTGTVSSEGAGAEGVVVLGAMNGAITNFGTIETFGTSTPSTALNASDPEGAQALAIANNVTGGVYNAGPINGSSTVASATIFMTGNQDTVDIAPTFNPNNYAVPVTIGGYTKSQTGYEYSLFNRGSITAASEDANIGNTAVFIGGSNGAQVTLTNGFFNSGAITATASTNADATVGTTAATALNIGNFVTVGPAGGITATNFGGATSAAIAANGGGYNLVNTNEAGRGTISASVSGAHSGTATAILLEGSVSGGTPGVLSSLFNSGTISASSSTTDLDDASISAYAIEDRSGTLTNIYNTGVIAATVTTLNNNAQIATAIDTSNNTTNSVTINDISDGTTNAEIVGDIRFGTKAGTLNVTGTSPSSIAIVAGNIYFNNASAMNDTLSIGGFGTVTGQIAEANGGSVDITIAQSGALNLLTSLPTNINATVSTTTTAGAPISVGALDVQTGGALNISVSQAYNISAFPGVSIINSNTASIGDRTGSIHPLTISFGGFVSSPTNTGAQFVLINSTGEINISSAELQDLAQLYNGSSNASNGIPFLFTSTICAYNVMNTTSASTVSTCSTAEPINNTNSELVLTLSPKNPALPVTQGGLGLTGYALKMFPYANEALVNDNTLGAAMVTDIKDQPTAQAAYASFAPDVSGATRATAISLTDSATNVVAARQRELRMYANQEGATTLWGQQFAERLSQANSSTLTGYNDSGFGFVVGMDDGDRVDGRYGGAFTFFTGGMSQKEPTSAKTSSEYYMLTGYTDWRGKGLFIDTQGTIGYANLKGNRYLRLFNSSTQATLTRDAQSQRASELLAGSVTMGGILTAGSTVFMPQVDVDGLTMREEGYTEIERRPGLRSSRPALLRQLAARLHRRGRPPGFQFR